MARVYSGLDVNGDQGGTFPWASRRVDLGAGVRMAVVDEGPKDAPITLLFVHGNPTWSYLYRRFLSHYASTYRCVAVDHVGFGRSDKPRDPAYYTLGQHVRNLETVAHALKLTNVVPVVQDWGGPIGIGYATRHAENIAGVVVLNTWAFVRDPPFELPWLFRFLVLGKGGWKRIVNRNIFTELFLLRGGARKLNDTEKAAYRAPHPTPEDRVGIARFPQIVPEAHDPTHESYATMSAIEDDLPKLRAKPALIVWAMKDVAFRKAALDRWTQLFERVDGPHRLAKARHYLQEDAPQEILGHLDRWLAATWPPGSAASGDGARAKKAVPRRAT